MKKITNLVLIFVLISIILTACGQEPAIENEKSHMESNDLEPNDDGMDDEIESAGVGEVDNGVADGEVVGDDYEMAEPDSEGSSTNDICDEAWFNTECMALTGQTKDACYVSIAEKKDEECICTNMVDDTDLKGACYMAVADSKNDYTICDLIDAVDSPDTQDACYMNIAEKTESVDPCNKVNNPMFKDGCYQAVASATGDKEICNMISQSALISTCEMSIQFA